MMIRLGFCLCLLTFCLYSYQNKQNELTHLKIQLPELAAEVQSIREGNRLLQYEIEKRYSPDRLIELAHHPEFGHLRHPLMKEILTVEQPDGIAAVEHGFSY